MHQEAYDGFGRVLTDSGLWPVNSWRVLDIGGQNVNGTVHDWLPNATFTTLDLENADIIADATTWRSHRRFDAVIATEVFEHVEEWPAVIRTMAHHLDPEGPQVLLATCASTGRRPHGATGAMDPAPGEWYENVPVTLLNDMLGDLFQRYEVVYSDTWGDAYMWARGLR